MLSLYHQARPDTRRSLQGHPLARRASRGNGPSSSPPPAPASAPCPPPASKETPTLGPHPLIAQVLSDVLTPCTPGLSKPRQTQPGGTERAHCMRDLAHSTHVNTHTGTCVCTHSTHDCTQHTREYTGVFAHTAHMTVHTHMNTHTTTYMSTHSTHSLHTLLCTWHTGEYTHVCVHTQPHDYAHSTQVNTHMCVCTHSHMTMHTAHR